MDPRRAGFGVALALLLALCGLTAVASASPPGPRLALVKLKEPERTQLQTIDPLGGTRQTLLSASAREADGAVYPFSAPSWSPDGTRIVFTTMSAETRRFRFEPKTMLALISADGGAVKPVAGTLDGLEPVFSPDGESIAFAKEQVRVRLNRRDQAREPSNTPTAVEEAPRWDPSGQRLAYTEWSPFGTAFESPIRAEATGFGFGKGVRMINADGTCSTEVFSEPVAQYFAAVWQPGIGREAGPISC